jgi:hypothetical protein
VPVLLSETQLQNVRAKNRRIYRDFVGAPEEIRTPDPQIRRLLGAIDSKELFCKTSHFVQVLRSMGYGHICKMKNAVASIGSGTPWGRFQSAHYWPPLFRLEILVRHSISLTKTINPCLCNYIPPRVVTFQCFRDISFVLAHQVRPRTIPFGGNLGGN